MFHYNVQLNDKIELAIAVALKSTDPKAQEFWKSVTRKGEHPTPEEVIVYIVKMTKN
ncbi:MAG: sporulation initiation factor Spo0A [Bacillota bacterium]